MILVSGVLMLLVIFLRWIACDQTIGGYNNQHGPALNPARVAQILVFDINGKSV